MTEILLRKGDGADTGLKDEVEELQEKLWDLGLVGADNPFWTSGVARRLKLKGPEDPRAKTEWIDGDFGTWTEESVMFAQHQLVGMRGIPLDEIVKLGVCDLDTQHALDNPEREQPDVPDTRDDADDLGGAIIDVWDHYIDKGVKESRGNNRGPYVEPLWTGAKHGGIDWWIRYNPKKPHVGGPAWCCYSRCGIEYEAHGFVHGEGAYFHSSGRTGLCYGNYKWGLKQDEDPLLPFIDGEILRGMVVDKKHVMSGAVKLPVGTCAIMNYGGTRGHTFSIAGIIYDKNGKPLYLITREGNISNKVGKRKRRIDQGSLKWFIVSPLLYVNADFAGEISVSAKESGDRERTR